MVLTHILDRLYVGSLDDVKQTSSLISKNIESILSVDQLPLPSPFKDNFLYKHLPLTDIESEDLLGKLNEAIEFIEQARVTKEIAVVVHCHAGTSRSVAIVIAYCMEKMSMTFEEAYEYVRKLKSDAMPNQGFIKQLKIYAAMGCKIDAAHKAYKQYRLERISQLINTDRGSAWLSELLSSEHLNSDSLGSYSYKCWKCRKVLFTDAHIITHHKGSDDFKVDGLTECKTSLFIEPVKWMQELGIQEPRGKITCLNCSAKIGSWCWSGEKCTCGKWITPAFHIDVKKVDKAVLVKPPIASVR